MSHIGENIAKLRGFRRLTQKEMAAKLELDQSEYSRIEKKAKIDEQLLQLIAGVLEVTPEAIKNLNEEATINVISSSFTLADNASSFNTYPIFNFNPIDKLVALVDENRMLYERLLKEKEETIKLKDEVIELYKQHPKAS